MGKVLPPPMVKPIFGLLYQDESLYEEVLRMIEFRFGSIDYLSDPFPFTETNYYENEMGADLTRRFLSVSELIYPDRIIHFKQMSNQWEEQFAKQGHRQFNLDPGYLAGANLVLASTKNFSHRIYLGRGIYAEVTMRYEKGHFTRLPWTYPDYFNHRDVFQDIRQIYKKQVHC